MIIVTYLLLLLIPSLIGFAYYYLNYKANIKKDISLEEGLKKKKQIFTILKYEAIITLSLIILSFIFPNASKNLYFFIYITLFILLSVSLPIFLSTKKYIQYLKDKKSWLRINYILNPTLNLRAKVLFKEHT